MSGRLLVPFALSALLIASGRAEAQDRSRLVLGGTLGFSNVTQKTTLDTSKMTGSLVGIDVGFRFWRAELRGRYVAGLAQRLRRGATYMLYAWQSHDKTRGIGPVQVKGTFAPEFRITRMEHGRDRRRISAWYWFEFAPQN